MTGKLAPYVLCAERKRVLGVVCSMWKDSVIGAVCCDGNIPCYVVCVVMWNIVL